MIDLARYRYRIGDLRADLEQGCITTAEYRRAREALRDELLNAEQVDGRKSGGLRERLMPLLFVLSVVGVAYLFYNWLDHPMSSAGFAVSNSSDIGVVASKDYRLQTGFDLPVSGRGSIGNHPDASVPESAEGLSQ